MPRTRAGFKQYERDQLRLLHWERIPVPGREGPDGRSTGLWAGYFYVEIRSRNQARPLRWFKEVASQARAVGQVPLLLFRGPNAALSPLVIMRWLDLVEVLKRVGFAGATGPDPAGQAPAADPARPAVAE